MFFSTIFWNAFLASTNGVGVYFGLLWVANLSDRHSLDHLSSCLPKCDELAKFKEKEIGEKKRVRKNFFLQGEGVISK